MPQMKKTLGQPTEKMSQSTRREYLVRMRVRYLRRHDPAERKALLDEFCEVSGHERKYALKLLLGLRPGPARSAATRGKRGKVYGEDVTAVLRKISRMADHPCGKRLKAMVPEMLPWYEVHYGVLESVLRAKVLKISAAQIDRLLVSERPPGLRAPSWSPSALLAGGAREPAVKRAPRCHCATGRPPPRSPDGSRRTPSGTAAPARQGRLCAACF